MTRCGRSLEQKKTRLTNQSCPETEWKLNRAQPQPNEIDAERNRNWKERKLNDAYTEAKQDWHGTGPNQTKPTANQTKPNEAN